MRRCRWKLVSGGLGNRRRVWLLEGNSRHESCGQGMEEKCDGAESAAEEATNAAA